jgi:hypothetical protein
MSFKGLGEATTLSQVPPTSICDKHLSFVDPCHVMETVHLYKYWPPVRLPRNASQGSQPSWPSYHVETSSMCIQARMSAK